MHVVGDRKHVARKSRDAIEPRVKNLALGALPQVLHFGKRAQQLVLEFGGLAFGLGNRVGLLGRSRVFRFGGRTFSLAGGWVRHCFQSILGNIRMPGISGLQRQKSSVYGVSKRLTTRAV